MADPINIFEAMPYDLFYDLYSRFHTRKAAELALLSKSWGELWRCGNHLLLDQRNFQNSEEFTEHVTTSIARYGPQNFRMDSCLVFTSLPSVPSDLMRTLVVRNFILHYLVSDEFIVERDVLERKNFARVSLTRCYLDGKISWPNLEDLRLCQVWVEFEGRDMVSGILGNCPLITDLEICNCRLSSFSLKSVGNLDRFGRLKSLLLEKLDWLSDLLFNDFSSKFPCLKVLTLRHCAVLDVETTIGSLSLKELNLAHNNCVRTVFDVPGIQNFSFVGKIVPRLSIAAPTTSTWQSNITIIWYEFQKAWFRQLNNFLGTNLSQSTVCLSLILGRIAGKKKNKMISAKTFLTKPVMIETLKIGVGSSPSSNALEALFCSFHPQFMYQRWMPSPPLMKATVEESIKFRELICRVLLGDRPPALHDLVKVVVEKVIEGGVVESGVSDAMQTFDESIRFKLQWRDRAAVILAGQE